MSALIFISGWWAAAAFFALWVRSLLKASDRHSSEIAEYRAAMHFAAFRLSDSDQLVISHFLRMFLAGRRREIGNEFPSWQRHRRNRIAIETGEVL